MSKNKKFTPLIFIPIAVAVFVLIFLAVSGHLTKTEDIKKPTAETSISVVNDETTEPTSANTDGKVTLCAVGDNLIHNTLIDAGKQEDGSYTTSREDDIMAFEQAGLDFDTFLTEATTILAFIKILLPLFKNMICP